ncbi:MAG: SDR family oxidoreductase [Alphaproteobacteria bacterium]
MNERTNQNKPAVSRRALMAGAASLAAAGPAFATEETANAASSDAAKAPDLSGLSILITGTSSGFGRLGAEYYARQGARVFATMRNLPRPEAQALRDLASEEKLAIEVIEIDVLSDDQVAAGVETALKATGGTLDVLVNNAGVSVPGPVEIQDMAATNLIFETNVMGCHRMARAVLPAMRAAKKGQIFQISSQLGRVMIPGFGQYSATKFALEAMSEQLAYELVPHGIEVTIIQPGGYPTNIWRNSNTNALALKDRLDPALLEAYPDLTAGLGQRSGGGTTDPMDVPRAIADIIAMPHGQRPLRRAVHPAYRPQEPINKVCAQTQVSLLGDSAYGPWIKAVHNVG